MKKPVFDFVDKSNMSLLTDFYELTMCQGYFENRRTETATFDLFIRRLPSNRSYFVFAGLEQALLFLQSIRFTHEQIDYLRTRALSEGFLDYVEDFRFTGEVWAVAEGTVVFPNEPLIRVTAPVIEAQIVETFLLNTVNLQTMIATKASRVVCAARSKPVVEFGLRRTQGTDAAMKAARCSYLAGCSGTSNVLAGMVYDIPVFGTMAHSYVMFFDSEIDAFRAFARVFPDTSTLLIDTYDDLAGAENAAIVAKELESTGHHLDAVRLDSGDLAEISKKVRATLDRRGLKYVKIFASGDLDEYKLEKLVGDGAPIDAFGVGTRMSTSSDRPYVDVVYKLSGKVEEDAFVPAMKLSRGKVTLPGRKHIFRQKDRMNQYKCDVIGFEEESIEGTHLLFKVMENGKIVADLPTLHEIRETALCNMVELPSQYKKIRNSPRYPVHLSLRLTQATRQVTSMLRRTKRVR